MIKKILTASIMLVFVIGCGGEVKTNTFKVTGKIHSGGAPIVGLPPGERPMVKFEAKENQAQTQAKVGDDGTFTADLAPGNYKVTGSAGFRADSNAKGIGMVSKDLKVDAAISDLDLDISKAVKKK